MRILVVTQYFWPENFRINDLASGLREMGHRVTILTGIPNYPGGRFFPGYGIFRNMSEEYGGMKVLRVPLTPRGDGNALQLAANYFFFAFFAGLLAPIRCREKYDLIFVYEPSPVTVGIPAILLRRIKKAPVMFWVQDLWPESLSATGAVRSETVLRCVREMVKFIYSGCDRILVQSRAFVPATERLGVDAGRILYFPNTVENFYRPMTLPQEAPERSEMPDGFRVMFAGNIGAAQDFETILAAAQRLREKRDIHWVILGEGRMRPWVESQIRERGLSATVHLLGWRDPETMPRYFSLADGLLVSLRKEPIFSLTIPAKVQSYLACARPIVAALDGEGAKVVEEAKAGVTCPAGDPAALTEAVLALYRKSGEERDAIGWSGRKYFERHFERRMLLDRLDGWMKELRRTRDGKFGMEEGCTG